MLPALISAGASLIGGLINKSSADKANEQQQQNALRQEALQREFAQNGISWKVADAVKAGLHPLIGAGATPVSYSPQSIGSTADTSLGSAIASSGQDISRAMSASATQDTRETAYDKQIQQLTLQKMTLENDILASNAAKQRGQLGPPMPSLTGNKDGLAALEALPSKKPDERPHLQLWGQKIYTHPGTSNAEAFEDRYGEGVSDYAIGPAVTAGDYLYNLKRFYSGAYRDGIWPLRRARTPLSPALTDRQRKSNWSNRGR